MQRPCSNCEKELKIPNVGMSHGICARHLVQQRAEFGLPPKEATPGGPLDIAKTLSEDEIKLLVSVFALLFAKDSVKRQKKWAAQKAA